MGVRPTRTRTFREAATKFLMVNQHKASLRVEGLFFKGVDSFIGALSLEAVHKGILQ
jgi:hypothetical protein